VTKQANGNTAMLLSCTGGLLLRYNFAMSRMASRAHRPFLNRQL